MRVLVTGVTGFVGKHLANLLASRPACSVRGAVRDNGNAAYETFDPALVGDIGPDTDWSAALHGVDVVVHTAARVHEMRDRSAGSVDAFRRVNTAGTLRLARQAADAGVSRLVFLSSIKVMGEQTPPGRPFRADDPVAPTDFYGISKHEAEQQLRLLAAESGLEVVIVRPVLVYGPGVKANFETMMRIVHQGIPLPFGALHNRRSLVAVQNLVSLIECCLTHPAAANETFLVSDGQDLSTTELLRRLAEAMHRPSRLLPVPESWLFHAARVLRREHLATRLLGSLQVDIEKTRSLLGWSPVLSANQGLAITAEYFRRNGRG